MPHLHLSLQAGDDLILKRMKRRHLRADAIRFCDDVRRLRPDIVFGADIIAGFPTETEAMFENSLDDRRGMRPDASARLPVLAARRHAGRAHAAGRPRGREGRAPRGCARPATRRSLARLAGESGAIRRILVERGGLGRTEHFTPVEIDGGPPGEIVPCAAPASSRAAQAPSAHASQEAALMAESRRGSARRRRPRRDAEPARRGETAAAETAIAAGTRRSAPPHEPPAIAVRRPSASVGELVAAAEVRPVALVRALTERHHRVFTKRKLDDDDAAGPGGRADPRRSRHRDRAAHHRGAASRAATTRKSPDDEVQRDLAAEVEKVLTPVAQPLELDPAHKPHVILVVGVNGTGKTTTIGKLAAKLPRGGLKVMLAAGDTFRAAAIEQLKIWGERTGAAGRRREARRRCRRPRLRRASRGARRTAPTC